MTTASRRSLIVRLAVICFFVFGLALIHLPDLVRIFGAPNGNYGLYTNPAGTAVRIIKAGSSSARSGLHVGDRIDLNANAPIVRDGIISGPNIALHADSIAIIRVTAPIRRTIVLRADPEPVSNYPLLVLRELFLFIPIAIGSMLLLMRPSPVTWWFFFMMLGAHDAPVSVAYYRLFPGPAAHDVMRAFRSVIGNGASFAMVMFAFSLGRRQLLGWRLVPIASAALLNAIYFFQGAFVSWAGFGTTIDTAANIVNFTLVLVGLADAYISVQRASRGKIIWLAVGLLVLAVSSTIDSIVWPDYASYATHTALSAVTLLFPFLCAYVLLSTRVVDIRFALSRTVVYGVITASAIAIFALIDVFLSRGVDQGRLSLPIDIVVAIALGFFVHNIHRHVDAIVDRLLFRRRYAAEVGLARAAKAVLHVGNDGVVGEYLVHLPVSLLDLTGAALYRHRDGRFALERHAGWEHAQTDYLDDDPLCVYLAAELGPVHPSEVPFHRDDTLQHAALAIPLVLRRQFQGFVLYGAHSDGATIDPEENRALMQLASNATVTYDHLTAAAMEAELLRLRSVVAAT